MQYPGVVAFDHSAAHVADYWVPDIYAPDKFLNPIAPPDFYTDIRYGLLGASHKRYHLDHGFTSEGGSMLRVGTLQVPPGCNATVTARPSSSHGTPTHTFVGSTDRASVVGGLFGLAWTDAAATFSLQDTALPQAYCAEMNTGVQILDDPLGLTDFAAVFVPFCNWWQQVDVLTVSCEWGNQYIPFTG